MDDLVWFVTSFVAKNKQERWLFKLQRGLDQFFTMAHRNVDSQLNERCRRLDSLEWAEAASFSLERRLKHGAYYDDYTQGDPVRFDAKTGAFDWSGLKDGPHDDSLVICRDRITALYLHHEGWVWLCAL